MSALPPATTVTPQHTYQVLTKRSVRLRLADRLAWPSSLWMGGSVENTNVLSRVDDLRAVPAAVRVLSCEPLLGPLDDISLAGIGWVVVGGESGSGARPMNPAWARDLRDRCGSAGVAFYFKQAGTVLARQWGALGKGSNPDDWPEPFPRDYPDAPME